MHSVYILQSETNIDQYYVGLASDVETRLKQHNAGKSKHTNKYRPWRIVSTHWFEDHKKAVEFERYLKSGSGRAFAKRRLR